MLNQMTVRAPEETAGRIKNQSGQAGTDKKCADPEYLWDWIRKEKEREKNEIQSK